jgi:hypothetical protein
MQAIQKGMRLTAHEAGPGKRASGWSVAEWIMVARRYVAATARMVVVAVMPFGHSERRESQGMVRESEVCE